MNNGTIISREKLVVPKVWTGVSALAVFFFSRPLGGGNTPCICFISTNYRAYPTYVLLVLITGTYPACFFISTNYRAYPTYVLLVLITGTYPACFFISTNYRNIPTTYIIHTIHRFVLWALLQWSLSGHVLPGGQQTQLLTHTEDVCHSRRRCSRHPTPGGRRGRAEGSMLPVQSLHLFQTNRFIIVWFPVRVLYIQ